MIYSGIMHFWLLVLLFVHSCPTDGAETIVYDGKRYSFIDSPMKCQEASLQCATWGLGDLVQVRDLEKYDALFRLAHEVGWQRKQFWIGLFKDNGANMNADWYWKTHSPTQAGSPASLSDSESPEWYWEPGYPKLNHIAGGCYCTSMDGNMRGWHDHNCESEPMYFICESSDVHMFGPHLYTFPLHFSSCLESMSNCQQFGSYFADVMNPDEQAFIESAMQAVNPASEIQKRSIALISKDGGDFVWQDPHGRPASPFYTYSNWAVDEPVIYANQCMCAVLGVNPDQQSFAWSATDCSQLNR